MMSEDIVLMWWPVGLKPSVYCAALFTRVQITPLTTHIHTGPVVSVLLDLWSCDLLVLMWPMQSMPCVCV